MRLYLFIVMVILASQAMMARADAETDMIQSGSYADFRQVLAHEAPTGSATLAATLRFPDDGRERYPAIVIVHTIAGYQEINEGWHADEFRKAGFATLTYSSVAARRLNEPGRVGSNVALWPSAVAEADAALRFLASHPRIDAKRIAIVGFSFGGEVALLTAFQRLQAALMPGGERFAAHVAYYPAGVWAVLAEQGAYTGAPILMLLGEKDDNLPIAKAQDYLAYAKAAGHPPPLEVSIYPGAYHAWTVSSLGTPRFYPQYGSTRKCPYLLLGSYPPALLVDGHGAPMDPDTMPKCLKNGQGYTMAYDAPARTKALAETISFLRKTLRP